MKRFSPKLIYLVLIVLAAWPLFNLNMVNQLDWGDDNCKYLEQAQQLANGQFKVSTNYIFNPKQFLGPKYYPNGYPLLLASWSQLFGFSVLSFLYLNTFLLVLSACCLFLIAIRFMSYFSGFAVSLLLLYHPAVLDLKMNVISEIAFLFFSLLGILLLLHNTKWAILCSGLVLAFAIHIRTVGWALMIISLLFLVIPLIKNHLKPERTLLLNKLFFFMVGWVTVYLTLYFLFPVKTKYPFFGIDYNLYKTSLTHISDSFRDFLGSFVTLKLKEWEFLGLFIGATFFFGGIVGWFLSLKLHPKQWLLHSYVAFYFLVVCCFRFGDAGFRFIFPVFPFLLIYNVITIKQVTEPFKLIYKPLFTILLVTLSIALFTEHYPKGFSTYTTALNGSDEPSAKAVFAYLKRVTKPKDRIAFIKPRALSYCINRKSVMPGRLVSTYSLEKKAKEFKFNYFIFYAGLTDNRDLKVMTTAKEWETVYQNDKAIVFKKTN